MTATIIIPLLTEPSTPAVHKLGLRMAHHRWLTEYRATNDPYTKECLEREHNELWERFKLCR